MRPIILVLLLVGALLAPAAPAVAEDGQKNPTAEEAAQRGGGAREGDDPEDDAAEGDSGRGRGRSDGSSGRGRDDAPRSPPPVHIGAFDVNVSDGVATGEFVTLRYGAHGVDGFTVDGTPLFNLTTTAAGGQAVREVQVKGSQMRVDAESFRLVVHDNPAAVSRISADAPVELDFAGGAQLTRTGDERSFAFTVGGLSGKIKGDLVANGTRLVGEGDILLLLDSVRGSADSGRPAIVDAIARGRVGAEASFNKDVDKVEQEMVSYGNVTMTTLKAEKGNLTVLVEGHGFDGRVLVLNVDGRVVGASKADELNLLFDNQTMTRADDLADALDPDDDGLQPEYYLLFDPLTESFQLVVSVPHYSVHTLSVTTFAILPPPSVVFGVVAGAALLVPAAFALFGRRGGRA